MLKVGVLGAGFMGSTHARAFAKIPGVQVIGISSRSAEKAAALAEEVELELEELEEGAEIPEGEAEETEESEEES